MHKWQILLAAAQKAAQEAQAIAATAKAENRDLTDDERAAFDAKHAEALAKKAESEQAKADADKVEALNELAKADAPVPADAQAKSGGAYYTSPRGEEPVSWGERFTKSEAFQQFMKAHPTGVGQGNNVGIAPVKVATMEEWRQGRKASVIGTPIAREQAVRFPTVDLVDHNRLTFLDLVSRGTATGGFEYVQITGVTRNAAIVPESTDTTTAGFVKPESDMTTALADAKAYTYADGYTVTNQLLSDAPAFASYLNSELAYSLDNVVEEKLLKGTGTGEPKGIMTTSGVQAQTYTAAGAIDAAAAMNFVKAARMAITKIVRLPGGTVNAIVLSPEMDEAIDLLQDTTNRFFGQGPFGSGPQTLWGRPRVTSERLATKEAVLGDFKQVALLDVEGLRVEAFNQHKDYASRNLVYVRAELRAVQAIWKPNRLCTIKPAA